MHQSPDDIFAAHFWVWPDPALKRDAQGRVLFVNAAFLQLFGGRVEDWRGQTVQGWAAPQPGPVPTRFEIRTPAQGDYPEQIYDWIELSEPDGSAFALARNVTLFASATPAPQTLPVQAQTEPSEYGSSEHVSSEHMYGQSAEIPSDTSGTKPTAAVDTVPVDPAPSHEDLVISDAPAVADVPALDVPDIDVPVLETPEIHVPLVEAAPASVAETAYETSYDVQTESVTPPTEAALSQPVAAEDFKDSSTVDPAPAVATAPVLEAPSVSDVLRGLPVDTPSPLEPAQAAAPVAERPTERDFERRPLPIENGDAVLGNNWRDAVIAKAVGVVEGPESAPEREPVDETPTGTTGGPIRILLAEDNAINALLTRTLLEAEGHTVETVEDGQLAVEAMKSSHFDMIFMDMRMPNMDGLEATRKIRTLPNVSTSIPIVALTANAFDDDRNACFDSGMNDFMTKPVSAEELSEMVARWTAKSDQALAS